MMVKNKSQRTAQLLSAIGLLLVTVPFLIKEYLFISDFFRGLSTGVGLSLMICSLIIQKKYRTAKQSDSTTSANANQQA
jgi:hypothetical protein